MSSKIIVTFLLSFITTVGFSQKKELKSITENQLTAHLEFIGSDNMQGCDFGTKIPGLEITAEYLKSECLKIGLKPGNPNFTQTVEMISIQLEKENTLIKLKNNKGEILFKSNEIQTFPELAKNDTIISKIVFAGYGYHNTETSYNDFEGLDLKDKLVMIMTRNREIALELITNDNSTNLEMSKLGRIFLSGAKAILFIPDPLSRDNSWFERVKDYASQ